MCGLKWIAAALTAAMVSSVALAQHAQTRPATGITASRPAGQAGEQEPSPSPVAERQARRQQAEPQTERQQALREGRERSRLDPRRTGQETKSGAGRSMLVEGQILDTREVSIEGAQREHLLVKVRTQQGDVRVVDLGSKESLGEHGELSSGDRVAVRGEMSRLNGRPIVVAEQFAKMIDVPREDDVFANDRPTWRDRDRRSQDETRGPSLGATIGGSVGR